MSARHKPLLATDRAALILQLVPYLIGKGEVSLTEAAEEFDVTVEQMRAMVEKLTVIGLPGDGGFWQMANDLFDIDWDLLDQQDLVFIKTHLAIQNKMHLPVDDHRRNDKHHRGSKLKDHQPAAKSRMTGAAADIPL